MAAKKVSKTSRPKALPPGTVPQPTRQRVLVLSGTGKRRFIWRTI